MVRREPALESFEPLVVPQDPQVVVTERLDPALGDLADRIALVRIGEADAVAHDLAHGVVARRPAEDEHDGREHVQSAQLLDQLGPPWRPVRQARPASAVLPVGAPATLQRPPHRLVDTQSFSAGPAVVQQQREHQVFFVLAPVRGEVVP